MASHVEPSVGLSHCSPCGTLCEPAMGGGSHCSPCETRCGGGGSHCSPCGTHCVCSCGKGGGGGTDAEMRGPLAETWEL